MGSKKHVCARITGLFFTSVLCVSALAQERQLTGKVLDRNGDPIIGANVTVVGSKEGTITDMDGKFVLRKVCSDAQLKVSYIGYIPQTVSTAGKTNFTVNLTENSQNLDELVVVGYGSQKKSDLTGSVGSVNSEKLVEKGSTTVMESLQGQVAGVDISQSSSRPGEGFNIQIRGQSTMQGGATPLYVVDGVVTDNINFLNPADIEKIDILKDASSTAIYGSRATNGVIMVTTKSASQGYEQRFSVTYDGYYGVKKAARMPEFMDGYEWANYRLMKYTKTTINEDGSVTRVLGSGDLANIWAGDSDKMKEMYRTGDFTDWMKMLLQKGSQQNHFINISGGTAKIAYRMGAGYQQEDGILGDNYKRYNVKTAIDSKFSDMFKAGMSVNLALTELDYGSQNAIMNGFRSNMYWLPYDEKGELNYMPGKDSRYPTGFSSTINPLIDMANSADETKTYNVLANFYLQLTPIKGLILKTTFSPTFSSMRHGTWYGPDSEVSAKTRKHQASIENEDIFSWTWDNQVNYSRTLGNHSLNATGVFSMYSLTNEANNITGQGFPFATKWYNMGAAESVLTKGSSYSKITMLSYILRLNYSYKDKYLVTVSSRWDGSSKFSKGNKWGAFPSMALAWRVNQESFLKDIHWLNNLKLRLSYGLTGNNAAVGAYTTQPLASTQYWYGFNQALAQGYGPSAFVNEALTWEKTKEFNIGLDFGLLNNRISGSVDWYYRISKDLLMEQKIPVEMGALGGKMWNNIGKVKNTGIEISLNTVNVKNRDWEWSTSFTFATNHNEIMELNGKKEDIVANKWFIGQPIDVMYELQYDGICTAEDLKKTYTINGKTGNLYQIYGFYEGSMKVVDQNQDGVIDSKDRVVQGHVLPNWTGSFTSNLYYKNWDFSFSIYTKQGQTVASPFIQEFMDYSDRGRTKLKMDFYVPEGSPTLGGLNADGSTIINTEHKNGSYPYPDNDTKNNYGGGFGWGNGRQKTYYTNSYVDASYVKIKNITVGYTFPTEWLRSLHISHLRVYANVLNPFTWAKYKGFDPEWADTSISNGQGGPSSVTWQFGINLKF